MRSRRRSHWADASLATKGWIVALVPVLAMLAAAVVGAIFHLQANDLRTWVVHTIDVRNQLELVENAYNRAREQETLALLNRRADAAVHRRMRQELVLGLDRLSGMTSDKDRQAKSLEQLKQHLQTMEKLDSPAAVARAYSVPEQFEEYETAAARFSSILDGMSSLEDELLTERLEQQMKARRTSYWFLGISVLIGLVGTVWVNSLYARQVTRRVAALGEFASRKAKGEEADLDESGGDELGRLADAVRHAILQMEEAQRTLETRVRERTHELAAANESLVREVLEKEAANARTEQEIFRISLLNQITKAIGGRQDIPSVFRVVLTHLRRDMKIDFSCVLYFEQESEILIVGAREQIDRAVPIAPDVQVGTTFRAGGNGLRSCLSGTPLMIPQLEESVGGILGSLAAAGLGSLAAAPMRVLNDCYGVVIAARREPASFSSGECEFLTQLGELVALAIAQVRLITDLNRANEELRDAQTLMFQQERLRAMGQMASGITHDINNALGPATIYCEMLLERQDLDDRLRQGLQNILKATGSATRTIAGLRYFYRPSSERHDFAPIDLNLLAEEVVSLSKPRWHDIPMREGVTVELRMELDSARPKVLGIEDELRNALTNLIFNAVDAMPQGGLLKIHTGQQGEFPFIEVTDTGTGMDEATRRRAIEPFFTTKGDRGTGLGLAMIFGIMKRHGGRIELESENGKGTTARLIFSNTPSIEKTPVPLLPELGSLMPLRVLCVDDDPSLRAAMKDLLLNEGHVPEVCDGGVKALQLIEAAHRDGKPFDVVFTDLGMPEMDGRELANRIARQWPTLPVILLTGWGSHMLEHAAQMPELKAVLCKPPRLLDIRKALSQVIRRTTP